MGKDDWLMPIHSIIERMQGERERGEILGLFFDFDGTLSEIVENPEMASILPGAKSFLGKMANREDLVAGVISGREIDDLKKRVGVPGLIYSGNHGAELEIFGEKHRLTKGEYRGDLSRVAEEFGKMSPAFPGLMVENKGFSVSVHARSVDEALLQEMRERVVETVERFDRLTVREGKKVFEILPLRSANKGEVLGFILGKIEEKSQAGVYPVYFGDDLTDKYVYDFLREKKRGISVFVKGKDPVMLEADFDLRGPRDVENFMSHSLDLIDGGGTV
jgi:trehalose-phosphatase